MSSGDAERRCLKKLMTLPLQLPNALKSDDALAAKFDRQSSKIVQHGEHCFEHVPADASRVAG
jgi:hypothetical protein